LSFLLKTHDKYYQAILLGLFVGFSTLHLQGLLEWIFRQTQVFYLFFILSGLMVAIGNIMKNGDPKYAGLDLTLWKENERSTTLRNCIKHPSAPPSQKTGLAIYWSTPCPVTGETLLIPLPSWS